MTTDQLAHHYIVTIRLKRRNCLVTADFSTGDQTSRAPPTLVWHVQV